MNFYLQQLDFQSPVTVSHCKILNKLQILQKKGFTFGESGKFGVFIEGKCKEVQRKQLLATHQVKNSDSDTQKSRDLHWNEIVEEVNTTRYVQTEEKTAIFNELIHERILNSILLLFSGFCLYYDFILKQLTTKKQNKKQAKQINDSFIQNFSSKKKNWQW